MAGFAASGASTRRFGGNVRALRVAGSFDDCQALVKRAQRCQPQTRVRLSSANSISLGRLLPQMSYYAKAALDHFRTHGEKLNFAIPTGNLGNALACILARKIGLPIGEVLLATNANDVLPRFFDGGDYVPQASTATLANAMDVGAPSNFERLRWLYPDPTSCVHPSCHHGGRCRSVHHPRSLGRHQLAPCPPATAIFALDSWHWMAAGQWPPPPIRPSSKASSSRCSAPDRTRLPWPNCWHTSQAEPLA